MVEFGLKILHAGLKKGLLDPQDGHVSGLLNALLPILVRCLASRHTPCITLGLKCLCLLVLAPRPGLRSISASAGQAAMRLIDKASSTTDPVCQDCFKLLARKP